VQAVSEGRRDTGMILLTLLLGFILLGLGGELLVRGAVGAARNFGISPLVVGLTIVAFGTSTPELVTSLIAAFQNAPGIAVGNVVGSNIANLLLILGSGALIAPLAMDRKALRREAVALAGSTLVCLAVVLYGALDGRVGAVMLVLLVTYVTWAYRSERRNTALRRTVHQQLADDAEKRERTLTMSLLLTALGIGMTILGAHWLVENAIVLSRRMGVSETVIGLTVVAIGTALPELVTSMVAAARGHAEVAIGNIIGSNVYNVLGILGATAILHPIDVPAEIARLDIWVLVAATSMITLFLITGAKIGRAEGSVLLGAYAVYLSWLVFVA
jgi:cation:H+ antiporter